MPAHSKIDVHPDRARIERDLVLGKPLSRLAKKYGLSRDSLHRHRHKLPAHMKRALLAQTLAPEEDLEAIRVEQSEGLLAKLAGQQARLLLAQDAALEMEQFGLVAQLSGQVHRNLELVGKYLGEFAQHSVQTNVHLLVTPQYLELRAALIRALQPYPEARRAVAEALHTLESAPPSAAMPPASQPMVIDARPN